MRDIDTLSTDALPGPQTVAALIDLWPSLALFAEDAGVTVNHAKQMRRRGSIALNYWPDLIANGTARDIPGLDEKTLVTAHTAGGKRVRQTEAA